MRIKIYFQFNIFLKQSLIEAFDRPVTSHKRLIFVAAIIRNPGNKLSKTGSIKNSEPDALNGQKQKYIQFLLRLCYDVVVLVGGILVEFKIFNKRTHFLRQKILYICLIVTM